MPNQTVVGFASPIEELEEEERTLNRRIVVTAVVLMAQLWALTAAIEAWADGRLQAVAWAVGFQVTALLLAVWVSTRSTAVEATLPLPDAVGPVSPAVE